MRKKYLIGLLIIVAAFAYLIWSSFMGAFMFAITPSELAKNKSEYAGKVVKLSGVVENGTISKTDSVYHFTVFGDGASVNVTYGGIVSNTFREGAEVLVTGIYNPEKNVLAGKEIVTKCASKYQGE